MHSTNEAADMTNPAPSPRIAAALAAADRSFAPRPIASHAANAAAFTRLAIGVVRECRERRRWLARVSKTNAGVWAFYSDGWTPEAAKLAALYRSRARECRAMARRSERVAQRQLIAAE